jgi:hypothetical protein
VPKSSVSISWPTSALNTSNSRSVDLAVAEEVVVAVVTIMVIVDIVAVATEETAIATTATAVDTVEEMVAETEATAVDIMVVITEVMGREVLLLLQPLTTVQLP